MKLTDLKPKWIGLANWASDKPFYVGISFLCPHCSPDLPEHGPIRRQRLAVSFHPPIDPENIARTFAVPLVMTGKEWQRISGETFETLTLNPSINTEYSGHWHGFIRNGEVI
jgi:hypothetical protein